MILQEIKLQNFRNIEFLSMKCDPKINVICGKNAQGKTNLLESIFFLSCVRSFHAKKESELVRWDTPDARIVANLSAHDREFCIDMQLSATKKRQILVNGIKQTRLLDFVGLAKTVLFSPEDLGLLRGGPAARRKFINIALSQLKPKYLEHLSRYQKVLEEKNKLLKSAERLSDIDLLLDVYNEQLSIFGASLISYRAEFLDGLARHAKVIHHEMSHTEEDFSAVYQTDRTVSLNSDLKSIQNALFTHLSDRKVAEFESKSCLVGPHRDDLDCIINGKSVRQFASQGQTRTAVLSLKLAERNLFFEATKEYPILLLDDVLSELDAARQNFVLNQITNGQVFITSCDESTAGISKTGRVFTMNQGILSE